MKRAYWIIGGLTAGGALLHYFLWPVFPDPKTAFAALLLWIVLGLVHLAIYAIHSGREKPSAALVVMPALIRLLLLPGLLVGLIVILRPEIKTFLLIFAGEVLFFMGLELGLAYRNKSAS